VYLPTHSLVIALIAMIPIRVAVLWAYDLPNARRLAAEHPEGAKARSLRPDVSFRMMREMVITTLPLGLALTLSSLNNSFPVYFLEAYSGETATGFYGATAAIMGAALIVGNTLGSTVSLTDRRAFRSLLLRVLTIGIAAGAGLLLFAIVLGKPFLAIVFKPEYADYSAEFVLMMGATGVMFVVSFLMYGLVAARALRGMCVGFVVITGVCVVLCWWLIPGQGVMGASIVRLLTGSLGVLVLVVVMCARLRFDKPLPPPSDKAGQERL
jgi:O-antigen/teichoic acid export membrane protein